ATRAESAVCASSPGKGVSKKWLIGSATPQKTKPEPKPVENNIPIHVKNGYSGLESEGPRRVFPCLPTDIVTRKMIKINTASKKNHPKLFVVKLKSFSLTLPNCFGSTAPITTSDKMTIADTKKTGFLYVCFMWSPF